MAIGYIKRLAGPYIGDGTGQKTFSFGFFVFTEGDVYVATAATENGASSNLQQGTDYTVTLNGDQEASPGGTITLTAEAGLADGAVLVIGSDVDYTQTLDLTNYTRFPPARISEELDRIVVQIQQLVEILGRTVKVDATDTMTPEELKQLLLEVAASAGTYRDEALAAAEAAAASESAAQTAQAAAELAQGKAEEAYQDTQDAAEQAIEDIGTAKTSAISEIQQTEQTSKTAVANEGTNQVGLVQAEGTKQIGLVGTKGTEQITAVGNAGAAQIQAVGAKGTEQIGLVQTEGTTQVNAVNQAGATQVEAVQAEGTEQVQAVTTVGNEKIAAATEQAEAAADSATAADLSASAAQSSASAASTSAGEAASAASAASGFASAAATSAGAASESAAAALASQNAASASETNAASSATAAAASQTAAKSSETNAKTSETNAKTSETNSKASENAAKDAQTAAEEARDEARGYADQASQGQMQADWAQSDSGQKDYIKNKPTLGVLSGKNTVTFDLIDSSAMASTEEAIDGTSATKLMSPEATAAAIGALAPPPTWDSVEGKPSTFPPSAHSHPTSQVNGLDATLASINTSITSLQTDKLGVNDQAKSAEKLGTTRTITISGDATWTVDFDGSANASASMTLANSGVTAGSYGQATAQTVDFGGSISIPYFTVDAKGRLTAAKTVTVTLPSVPDLTPYLTKTDAQNTYLGKTAQAESSKTSDDAQSMLQAFIDFATENNIV